MSTGQTAIFCQQLAHAIGRLGEQASSWIYVINADAPDGLFLRCRLGMESHDYEAMLVGAGLATIDYNNEEERPGRPKKTLLIDSRNGWETFVKGHQFEFIDDPGMPGRPEWDRKQFDMDNKVKA